MVASGSDVAHPERRAEDPDGPARQPVREVAPWSKAGPLVIVGSVLCMYSSVSFLPVSGIAVALGLPAAFVATWALSRRPAVRSDAELLIAFVVLATVPLLGGPLPLSLTGNRVPDGLMYVWPTAVAGLGLAALERLRSERTVAVWGGAVTAAALVAAPLWGSNLNGANLSMVIVSAAAVCLLLAGLYEWRRPARPAAGSSTGPARVGDVI